eukprot:8255889-Pyramimonas_sp.AAC.1
MDEDAAEEEKEEEEEEEERTAAARGKSGPAAAVRQLHQAAPSPRPSRPAPLRRRTPHPPI